MQEALAPGCECAGVMGSDVFHVNHFHVTGTGKGLGNGRYAGNKAAGENITLDKIHLGFGLLIPLVVDGDGLQQGNAVVFQQTADGCGVGVQELVTNRFNHFDGDQFIVLTFQQPVILLQQSNFVLQPFFSNAALGPGILFFGNGGGGNPTAIMLGRVNGHAAPSGPDFQQMIVRI